jgi:hypothetical protein
MNDRSLHHLINIIATFTLLIPISAGISKYKYADFKCRLFLFFLVYGFITDLIVWLLLDSARGVSYFFFNFYNLVESLFLFWYIMVTNESTTIKKICRILLILAIPAWLISYLENTEKHMATFSTAYDILLTFLIGYALLKMGEKAVVLTKEPTFWFFLGIFIYCFCTFFISSLMETELRQKIWFIHNIINFVSYLILAKGFLTITPSGSVLQSS